MAEAELRAKIRELMTSGALPSDPSVVASRGTGDLGLVKNPLPATCTRSGRDGLAFGSHWDDRPHGSRSRRPVNRL